MTDLKAQVEKLEQQMQFVLKQIEQIDRRPKTYLVTTSCSSKEDLKEMIDEYSWEDYSEGELRIKHVMDKWCLISQFTEKSICIFSGEPHIERVELLKSKARKN